MDVPVSSHICQWHQCVKSGPPALACPTPPHNGAKPVSRTCTPNCCRVTCTDKEHSACAQVSFSPAGLCSIGDASKCLPVPVISLEISGASTCTGQGPHLHSHANNALEVNKSPPRSCTISLPMTLGLETPSSDSTAVSPCQGTQKLPRSRQDKSLFFCFMKQQQRL